MIINMEYKPQHSVAHPFEAIFNKQSRILILGTIPSVRSRESGFYYAHPRNRFWLILAHCFNQRVPETVKEKIRLLHNNRIAVWDVLAACEISGSDDSSIRNADYNDIAAFVKDKSIEKILCNGKKAYSFCCRQNLPLPVRCMPSTSPANAAWSVERLTAAWKEELTADSRC